MGDGDVRVRSWLYDETESVGRVGVWVGRKFFLEKGEKGVRGLVITGVRICERLSREMQNGDGMNGMDGGNSVVRKFV